MDIEAEKPKVYPVRTDERIDSLDVLRGVAVLGILVMNIQSFGLVDATRWNPHAMGRLSGLDYGLWLFGWIFFKAKFITLFSMLFGAGIAMMGERCDAAGRSFATRHYRRMLFLGGLGLAHGYFFWDGDILFLYALCGCGALLFRKAPEGLLYLSGAVMLCVASLSAGSQGGPSLFTWPESTSLYVPGAAAFSEEIEAFRGSWQERRDFSSDPESTLDFTANLLFYWGWRYTGLMFIGMALYKGGLLNATASTRSYCGFLLAALLIGVPLDLTGVCYSAAAGWDPDHVYYVSRQLNYWASIFSSLGWIGGILLLCKLGVLRVMRSALGNVGRMALTNYLGQTLICTTIFYGHGLGFFAAFNLRQLCLIMIGIWAFQILFSALWLRYFRWGPFEYLWRAFTYLRAPHRIKRAATRGA